MLLRGLLARRAQRAHRAFQRPAAAAAAAPSFSELCDGLPVVVGSVQGAGRGLYAVVDVPCGSTLLSATPVACHPPAGDVSVCHGCLRTLPATSVHAAGRAFCCPSCRTLDAERRFLSSAAYREFEALCQTNRLLHPLIAGRLACEVTAGLAHPDALSALCFARGAVQSPPPLWVEEHRLLKAALCTSASHFLTLEWYTAVLARLHLNAFRVDIPRLDVHDLAALARSAAHGSGTAVYALPSLLNHSCDPNVDAVWRHGDSKITLAARRDIAAGEELTITYIDASEPAEERREALRFAYGFECRCAACVEELELTQ